MKPWRRQDTRLDRASVWYVHPPREKKPSERPLGRLKTVASAEQARSFYSGMLLDDIVEKVLPIGGRGPDHGADVFALSSEEEHVEEMLSTAFAYGRGSSAQQSRRDLSSAVCNWGRSCTSTLVRKGRSVQEVAWLTRPDLSQPVGFRVIQLGGLDVTRRWGRWIQRVPPGALGESRSPYDGPVVLDYREIRLPSERIVEVKLPRRLRHLPRALETLAMVGRDRYPDFFMPDPHADPNERVPVVHRVYWRTQKVAVAHVTRQTGWTARGTFAEDVCAYYSAWRLLQFERCLVALRQTVLKAANEILELAGKKLGFSNSVQLRHLPTLRDVETAERELRRGDVSTTDLLRRFSIY